jgi:hemolysin III
MMNKYFREPVNGFTHLIGAVLAFAGLIWLLVITWPDWARTVVSLVYGLSVIAAFSASTLMHLYNGSQRVIKWLIRFDHASIYIMIAGTYTPIAYVLLDTAWFVGIMIAIWGMALGGVVWKLFFYHEDTIWSLLYYLGMGWFSLILLPRVLQFVDIVPFVLIVSGGLMYTIGAVIFGLKKPNFNEWWGHHEIWHLFVLAGCAFHFFAVLYQLG